MIRVAFCGPRASGKSTLAQHLWSVYEIPRYALATPIKRIIADAPTDQYERHLYLWNWAHILYPEASDALRAKFVTGVNGIFRTERDRGRLAQQIGGLGRELDRDVWVRYLLNRLPAGNAVVEDVRYANEVAALRSAGFILVRLHAPSEVLAERIRRRGHDRRDPNHESEHSLPAGPYDAEWDTSEPIEFTLSRLDRLVERLSARKVS